MFDLVLGVLGRTLVLSLLVLFVDQDSGHLEDVSLRFGGLELFVVLVALVRHVQTLLLLLLHFLQQVFVDLLRLRILLFVLLRGLLDCTVPHRYNAKTPRHLRCCRF